MRLKSLKLSGFKSFVDSTSFDFPSNLVGIVGPNGCGKSNSIDAVRWVMGERSAKHLRGDSMSDVIFNGAKTRKPVGKASVEMVFDNSQGKVQGQYAAYNEISVKRAVSRDGQSDYFLNNVKVRRRDVMDLFLGTGLGPRSYAIIEQGMISRFVEAKPDDIRVMIEEAAGVSKYKERRRETENRIKHTKENLDRVTDLSEEIAKHLARLDRQAKAAEKYKVLKKEQKVVQAQLLALQWQAQEQTAKTWQEKIAKQSVDLEAQRANLQTEVTAIEKLHQQQAQDTEALSKAQSVFYQTRSDLQAAEQKRGHLTEQQSQIRQDLEEINSHRTQSGQVLEEDKGLIANLEDWLGNNSSALTALQVMVSQLQDERSGAERKWTAWQNDAQTVQKQAADLEKTAAEENTKIQQLEVQQVQLHKRMEMLAEEKAQLPEEKQEDTSLLHAYEEAKQSLDTLRQRQHQLRDTMQTARKSMHSQQQTLDSKRKKYQESRGRLVSLETLQQNILAKTDSESWLKAQGLASHARLAEVVAIAEGWEQAAEVVLGDFLEAICLQPENRMPSEAAKGASVTLLQPGDIRTTPARHKALASLVTSDYAMGDILAGVYVADTDAEALALRTQLQAGESVVSKTGLWYGPSWMRVVAQTDGQQPILEREQEIRELRNQCETMEQTIARDTEQLETLETSRGEHEKQQEQLQQEFNQAQQELANLQSRQSALLARNEQLNKRRTRVTQELEEIGQQINQAETEIVAARQKAEQAVAALHGLVDQRSQFEQTEQPLLTAFEAAKTQFETQQSALHQLTVEMESKKSQLASTQVHVARVTQQLDSEGKRYQVLQQRLQEIDTQIPGLETTIKTLIDTQVKDEQTFSAAKQQLNDTEYAYQEKTKRAQEVEQKIQSVQSGLEQAKLQAQESVVRAKTLVEQLQQTTFDATTLLTEMDDEASVAQFQQTADAIEQKIQRLGAINLAAIDEFQTESDRKVHIDKQLEDLHEALATLESAIAKIDRETKDRFKETFDKINEGVQHIFPELFGGGRAYLELTDTDLLHTGVTIMAQPPGKRNSTIHLLSGGEKALTAVSLVFAIFELNPAPFCMLDEVDAPLDDANVARFCAMVKKMSAQVQFIFITHNKITMELSNQLMGVTMHEAGVSRLVAVDVQEAAEMVGTA